MTIIAIESDFLIINKPAGVHFHSQQGKPGLVAMVSDEWGARLFPVHRLDTITSGILLLARSQYAARTFSELFAGRRIEKYYLALARGKPKKKQGLIIGDMKKSRRGCYKLLRSSHKPAATQFFSKSTQPGTRCYLLKPLSGKTHQLRVALSAIGCPILGDTFYGGEVADRAYLHAWCLAFEYEGKKFYYRVSPDQGIFFSNESVVSAVADFSPPESLSWPSGPCGYRDNLREKS